MGAGIDVRLRKKARALASSIAALVAIAAAAIGAAQAQTPEEFYRGKQIRMIVGHPPAGDYDSGGRLLAKYLSRHLPGHPSIVVQNMPTAASIAATNMLYTTAPKDGTMIGSFGRNLPSQAVLGHPNLQLDMRRFEWLGAVSRPRRICVSWHTSRVKRAEDLFTQELIVAGGGATSALSIVPTVINHVLGTKFRIVEGYKGFVESLLALQRGEVEGICNVEALIVMHEELIRERKVHILLYSEMTSPRPDVPSVFQFVKDDEQAQFLRFAFSSTEFGRPYVFPPGVPADRVAAMRNAFKAALADPELMQEAGRANIDMSLTSPEDLLTLIDKLYATSPQTLDIVRKLLPAGG
jgi:tripartite-type tricarboxylate transporter receptor subunit TctC